MDINAASVRRLSGFAMAAFFICVPIARELSIIPVRIDRATAADHLITFTLAIWTSYVIMRSCGWRIVWTGIKPSIRIRIMRPDVAHQIVRWSVILLISLGFQRLLWVPWRFMQDAGRHDLSRWYELYIAPEPLLLAQTTWWMCMIMMSAPYLRRSWGAAWSLAITGIVFMVWSTVYQLPIVF